MSSPLLTDLFNAYYDARKNKRSTINALKFEIEYEKNLFQLYEEIIRRRYEPSQSICFISFHPVKREIFAADFRDRIVHHLIYNYINPIFERLFINDCYSCRIGKGTSYGIERAQHFVRSCSRNYKKDCYILKLDIKGYFMSMDRHILYTKVKETLDHYRDKIDFDLDLVLYLLSKIIFHDPTKHCCIKGSRKDWVGLPKSKSLFFAPSDKGFPIGNLTSQLFGNIYLNAFDQFMKKDLRCRCYGRYVDDFIVVYQDKEYLKAIIPKIRKFLKQNISLELHPKKIYLQHYTKGFDFLGAIIKPYRTYIRNKTKGNFYRNFRCWNRFLEKKSSPANKKDLTAILSSGNSYLGTMTRHNTYKIRKKALEECFKNNNKSLPGFYFAKYFTVSSDYNKLILER